MAEPDLSGFSLTDTYDPGSATSSGPPRIVRFTASSSGGSPGQLPDSLQVLKGATVTLAWQIEGAVDELDIDGAGSCPAATATRLAVTVSADTDFTLHAKNAAGEDQRTVHVAVHPAEAPASPHLKMKRPAAGKGTVIADGKGNVVVEPPVRLLAQYDARWATTPLAGAWNSKNVYWRKDGCSPSCAAMILRWYAEDVGACRYPEVAGGSKLAAGCYGQRMGEAFWPDGFQYYSKVTGKPEPPGNPQGRVSVMGGGGIDYPDIFNYAAYWLRHGEIPGKTERERATVAKGAAYAKYDAPKVGWLEHIRALLKSGPVILGLGEPGGHFVVCEGVRDGALLIVDPGAVLYTAVVLNGEGSVIKNWHGKQGFALLKEGEGKPPAKQWPGGAPRSEQDEKCYVALSGAVLDAVLAGLQHVHSLSYPDFNPAAASAPAPAPAPGAPVADPAPPPAPATPAPSPGSSCAKCDALEKLIGAGVERKIRRKSPDHDCVALLQFHLVAFGYPLGASGPNGDGVDGDYGNLTARALRQFLDGAGAPDESEDALGDAAARLILQKHRGGAARSEAPQPDAAAMEGTGPVSSELEAFFRYHGWIGPAYGKGQYDRNRKYTYNAYRVQGKPAWFLRGRGMVDVDGAPNAYHPTLPPIRAGMYPTWDVMRLDRPLDSLADGPSGMQKGPDGNYYVQTKDDPAPGFYVMHTPLQDGSVKHAWDPRRYADARVIPYFAIPQQILAQRNIPSKLFDGWESVGAGHTGNFGDYVTGVNLKPAPYSGEDYPPSYLTLIEIDGKKYPIAHGLIGDTGNKPHVGEHSYAFARLLHNLNGPEWADVLWIIHPGSGQGQYVIPDPAEIQSRGAALFDAWGGRKQLETILGLPELAGSGR